MSESTVRVPRVLHELHGERSTWSDVIVTHAVAWGLAAAVLLVVGGATGALLAFLMVDIAGGVVSNVTRGTNEFYVARPGHRLVFLSLHVLQPSLILLFVPGAGIGVALIAAWTLSGAALLERLRRAGKARDVTAPVATAWAVTGIAVLALGGGAGVGTVTSAEAVPSAGAVKHATNLLLTLYLLKLLPSFSVDWYSETGEPKHIE